MLSDAGILVRAHRREHGIREATFLADVLEQPRAHRPAEDRVQRIRRRSGPDDSAAGRSCRGRCGSARAPSAGSGRRATTAGGPSITTRAPASSVARTPASTSALHTVVLEIADRDDDEVARRRRPREIPAQRRLIERRHAVRACRESGGRAAWPLQYDSANISCTRSSGVSSTILISSRTTFFSRSMSSGAKDGVRDQIGQDVGRERQVLVEHLDVVARVFLRRERVELTADRVHLLRDVLGRPRSRALEQHVLDEMRDAGSARRLVTRAAGQPHADRHRSHVRHRLGHETKTVRERLASDAGISHVVSGDSQPDERRRPLGESPLTRCK